jgi:multidrug efflux pump subunit AcrA (membrane-fusion protein)
MENNKSNSISIWKRIKNNWVKLLVGLVLILIAGAFIRGKFFAPATPGQYVLGQVVRGDLVTKVKGTGQVSAHSQVDLKPQGSTQSSAVIEEIDVKQGDKVVTGQLVATIDNRSALTALHQAQANLQNSQANYSKLVNGSTVYEIKSGENSVVQAEQSCKDAQTELENTKQSTVISVAQAQQSLDDVLSSTGVIQVGINTKRDTELLTIRDQLTNVRNSLNIEKVILDNNTLDKVLSVMNPGYKSSAEGSYNEAESLLLTANNSYNLAKSDKSDINLIQANSDIGNVLNKSLFSLDALYKALQNTLTASDFSQTQLDSYISSINNQIVSVNSGITAVKNARQNVTDAILSASNSVKTAQNSLENAQTSAKSQLTSAESKVKSSYNSWQSSIDSLSKLKAPARKEDVASALAQLSNYRSALESAQYTYDQNFLRSPFDGEVAQVNVSKGDQTNTNTVVATIITSELYAEISLNELDAAQTKIGASSTVTFDALPGVTIQGRVAQIDTIGTVNQGVVSYNAKVSFNVPNPDVKPGMSVSVSIVTNTEKNQLLVPSSAIKTVDGISTIQIPDSASVSSAKLGETVTLIHLQSANVEIGDTDNVQTVIRSGLEENQIIIARQIAGATAKSSGGFMSSPK